MSEGLSRDELIEKATRALHADHCCNGDDTGCVYPDEMSADQYQARIVLNAGLSAVADDLEARAKLIHRMFEQRPFGEICDDEKRAVVRQWFDAAERVRGLLGKDK